MAYLINPREKGLPYILADLDYDVWVGNTRGSVYAQKHKKLNPDEDQSKFWDFRYVLHRRFINTFLAV